MRFEFALPDLGEGLTEGEVVTWHVAVGDEIALDQLLVDVETAKAVVEITSPVAGTVLELGAGEGGTVDVGALLVAYETADAEVVEAPHDPAARAAPVPTPSDPPASVTTGEPPVAPAPGRRRALASPSTRRRALTLGIDLATVRGSGPAGRITRADVEAIASGESAVDVPSPTPTTAAPQSSRPAAVAPPVPRGEDEVVPLRGVRKQVAMLLTQSWTTIPHVTEFRDIDATRLVSARASLRDRLPADAPSFTMLPIIVKAVALALRDHRTLNAMIDVEGGTITYRSAINIGVATSSDEGLVVPVVHDADHKSVYQISRDIAQVAADVRDRRVRPAQLEGGTFTVSNFGSYGTRFGSPIIRPPEVGIAGFGRVRDEVVPVDGQPAVRPIMPVSVAADHRLVDGLVMGLFVNDVVAMLEDPILLLGNA